MPALIQMDNAMLTKVILFSYPVILGQGIIGLESLRILPAEFRIWRRAYKRGRFNAAEYMFLAIKYFAIAGFICDIIFRTTTFLTSARQCYITHYVSTFFILFDTTLVALAIAWRTYIIFQCNRKVYWLLCLALAGQLGLSMWSMVRVTKVNALNDGYCEAHYPKSHYEIPTMQLALPYFLMYNVLYDLLVTAAATRHLVKSTGASFGVSEISRVLFHNNVHYVLVVCTVNFTEAVLLYASPRGVPNMMHTSCALQIITAMNLLAIEQDLVHRPTTQRVSHAPSSALKSDPSSKDRFSPSAINQNWQTNSKQEISTFQSDSSSVGSPILHSLWNKKSIKKNNHSNNQFSKSTPGITFEQKKMHFVDDFMSDVEKQNYISSPDWCHQNGSPKNSEQGHSTFIIANPDSRNGSRIIYQENNPTRLPLDSPGKSSPPFGSSDKFSLVDYQNSPKRVNVESPAKVANGNGVSIRSIRANMESATVDDYLAMTPPKPGLARPQTSPITPLQIAKKKNSPDLDKNNHNSLTRSIHPTFEISLGKGATVKIESPSRVDEEQMSFYRDSSSAASVKSVSTKASFTSQKYPYRRPMNPTNLHHGSQSSSNTLRDREQLTTIDNDNISSTEDVNTIFGVRRVPPRRLDSLELDDDPFRC